MGGKLTTTTYRNFNKRMQTDFFARYARKKAADAGR